MRTLLVLAAALAAVAPAAAVSRPTLALTPGNGVVVHGTAFKPRELVRVTLTVEGVPSTVRIRATARGRFAASYPKTFVDVCTDWKVVARGARGSRAALVPRLSRECPPPPPP